MKALIQRVSRAWVEVSGTVSGRIGRGLLVFLGIEKGDTEEDLGYLVKKIVNLRVFPDSADRMNRSLRDVGGGILVVSQFTLAADCRRGNRPSFDSAEDPSTAEQMYGTFVRRLQEAGIPTATGTFAAHMDVNLVNDGPVTILIDSRR